MKKYWLIIKNTWSENLTYRANFVMWRVRIVIRFLVTFFLWSSIYSANQQFFGYTRETMLTYILLVYIVSNFVFATRTQEIAGVINEGALTNYLIKPINFFAGMISRDAGDKLLNFLCTTIEFALLFFILKPPLFLQTELLLLLLCGLAFVGSIVLYFYISLLMGFIGFWTTEVWATRFIFLILLDYLAGGLFPIDILPPLITKILLVTPFPYLFYFPVKLYLGELAPMAISQGFIMLIIWMVVLAQLMQWTWRKGLKIYSAEGR